MITLTTGEIAITQSMTIAGPGAAVLAVSGNNTSRIFNVSAGAVVAVSGLTIENGSASSAAGILNNGSLTVTGSTLTGNTATGLGGVAGGIYNGGSLTVSGSTLTANTAHNGGGIYNAVSRTLSVSGSTLTGNTAKLRVVGSSTNSGSVTVTGSTLTGNTADFSGGGIYAHPIGTVTVRGALPATREFEWWDLRRQRRRFGVGGGVGLCG